MSKMYTVSSVPLEIEQPLSETLLVNAKLKLFQLIKKTRTPCVPKSV
jgi:hypothetical protein